LSIPSSSSLSHEASHANDATIHINVAAVKITFFINGFNGLFGYLRVNYRHVIDNDGAKIYKFVVTNKYCHTFFIQNYIETGFSSATFFHWKSFSFVNWRKNRNFAAQKRK
jgi:hypothetical protein